MAGSPTQVASMALDSLGVDQQIGNIEEGSRVANILLRAYGRCRQDLLRTAPWSFARKQVTLVLLAQAGGDGTNNIGTVVPGYQFAFEYQLPSDCVRIRYIPWSPYGGLAAPSSNITPPNSSSPLTSAPTTAQQLWAPIQPSLYQITNDPNYPLAPQADATLNPGQSPTGSTVILSNVPNATLVYTFDAVYPTLWDGLFTSAMVAYLASEVALALWSRDPKHGRALRIEQIAIAKQKVTEARIADGNASAVTTSHIPDWMRARTTLGSGGYATGGWGVEGGGFYGCWGGGYGGSLSLSDGSSF